MKRTCVVRVCMSLLILVWSLPLETFAGGTYSGSLLLDRTVDRRKLKKKTITQKEIALGAVTPSRIRAGADGQVLVSGGGAVSWQAAPSDGHWNVTGTDLVSGVSGNVGIGTTNPGYKLDVNGTIHVSESVIIGNTIIIDRRNDRITASSGRIDFVDTSLTTTGTVEAGTFKGDGSSLTGIMASGIFIDPEVVWVSTNGTSGGDGSMKNPYPDLYKAIDPTNTGKTIVVMPGQYDFDVEITISAAFSDMTIMGFSDNPEDTLLNSTHTGQRIFNVNGGTNISILNFSFTSTNFSGYGGAVYLNTGTIKNCQFTDCAASLGGGGVYADNSTVEGCKFIRCSGGSGGGVAAINNATVIDCTFTGCSASYGGGVDSVNTTNMTVIVVKDCEFSNCSASLSGGGVGAQHTMTVIGCEFNDCSAGESGGGLYVTTTSQVSYCGFYDCSASAGGGAYTHNNGTVSYSEFYDCSATVGGGVFVSDQSTVAACEFRNCDAFTAGGGVLAERGSKLKYCDIPRGSGKINSIEFDNSQGGTCFMMATVVGESGAADFIDYSTVDNDP